MIAAFVDSDWIEDAYFMEREPGLPEKYAGNPVIMPGKMVGTVIRDSDRLWKMWYTRFLRIHKPHASGPAHCSAICFAISQDGLKWEKPTLGVVKSEPGEAGNIVLTANQTDAAGLRLTGPCGAGEFCVLDAASGRLPHLRARFTAVYLSDPPAEPAGVYLAYSDDGLRWLRYKEGPIIKGWPDSHLQLFYDERAGCYALYLRPTVHAGPYWANRMTARAESRNLLEWSVPRIVLASDAADAPAAGTVDEGDGYPRGRDRQIYGMRVFPYRDIYLGLAQIYDVPSGRMWLELAHSRDGLHWEREPRRRPFLEPGSRPAWDCEMIGYTDTGAPNRSGEMLHIYYSGANITHHKAVAEPNAPNAVRGIGLALMKADRFVGYCTGAAEGELLTRPFIFDGEALTLNADVSAGSVAAELTDECGVALPGFSRADCRIITAEDGPALSVFRSSAADLAGLRGRRLRLRIFARQAALYGFACI